jgi:sodium transport system permease protein
MKLKTIRIIFRKELLDTLRDRKTLILMVALPTLLMPGLMALMARVAGREARKTAERRYVIQAEDDERDRLCSFLRARLAVHRPLTEQMLDLYGSTVAQPLRAIAADLAVDPFEVFVGIVSDPRIRSHPRAAELKDAIAPRQREVLSQVRAMLDDDERGAEPTAGVPGIGASLDRKEASAAKQFIDLLGPLVTFDYVPAAAVAGLPALQAPTPIANLPREIRGDPERSAAAIAVSERRIQALLRVPRTLDEQVGARDDTITLDVVYDSTIEFSAEANRRIEAAVTAAREFTMKERLAREDLPASFVEPVRVEGHNAAPPSKEVLKAIASFLPYLLILMCFLGGLTPATDLGAGEKERLTLETLLVAPSTRLEIAIGKFGVVFIASLVASLLATGSMAYTFTSGLASKELSHAFQLKLDVGSTLLCLALIAPLAATFASLMLALSIYAKSQKEAQTLMMPLQFLIIIPAMLSMIPSIELNARMAWVPVMNVALGLRAILTAGGARLPWLDIAVIFASTTMFAALALLWCARRFSQERVIFRS